MKNWITTTCCIFLFALATSISAQSAYMKFDGVDGEATDRDHKGWSDLASFSQAITRPSGNAATGATRRRGSATLGDIVCVKELDKAGPKIAESVCTGKVFPKVEIHLTKSLGSGGRVVYYTYELKNVQVTSYQISSSDSDHPVEELALNFTEIKTVYTEYDAQGRKKGNIEYSWKVEEGR